MSAKARSTKANGTKKLAKETVLVSSFGKMGLSMRACGEKIELMEEAE